MLSVKNKIINLSLIDNYTKNQNVALLAFSYIMDKKSETHITSQLHLEDIKMSLELFLYDLQSVDKLLNENTEYFIDSLASMKTDVTATKEQKKRAACIADHLKVQNVALLALHAAQIDECNGILRVDNKKDLKSMVGMLMYNLNSIHASMMYDMESLWGIKDEIATKRRELGIYPLFSFKQQEEPLKDNQADVTATSKKLKPLPNDILLSGDSNPKISLHFDGIFSQVIKLGALKAVAKGGKYAMTTSYTKGLSSEEVADFFDGIIAIAEPIIEDLYALQNEDSREAFECLYENVGV